MKLTIPKNRPLIMGVLNLTPDSFSDGGQFNSIEKAKKRVKEMEKEGADIIDIGGESTGPGSKNVKLEEELNRVIPIIKAITKITKLPISIDTYKADVADQALQSGAKIINDVTGLRGDKEMVNIARKHQCPIVIMYSKDKTARTSKTAKHYKDVIKTIKAFLEKQSKYAIKNGIKKENIILDPGMGAFISTIPEYSYEIISRLSELPKPLLIGISRKSFLGGKLAERDFKAMPLTAIAYLNGASIIRTHDVKGTVETFKHLKK